MDKGQGPKHTTKRKRSYMDKAEAHMASTLQLTHTKQSCWALQLKLVLQQLLGLKGKKKTHTKPFPLEPISPMIQVQ